MSETFVEWRVTGTPDNGDDPYEFVWSPDRNPHIGDRETAARKSIDLLAAQSFGWTEGPTLSRRTVTKTDWEVVP